MLCASLISSLIEDTPVSEAALLCRRDRLGGRDFRAYLESKIRIAEAEKLGFQKIIGLQICDQGALDLKSYKIQGQFAVSKLERLYRDF